MPDHVHVFFEMRPTQSLADLMQDIKGSSSKWINDRKFINDRFEWQEGYGAFSYGKSQVSTVIKYIENQEVHHRKISFLEEYRKLWRYLISVLKKGIFLKSRYEGDCRQTTVYRP